MTAQHTPGPWALGVETDLPYSAQIIAADGSYIAVVECDPVEDNARLIAAAPLMLDALQQVAEAFELDEDEYPLCDAMHHVAQAIRAATGEDA